MINKKHLFMGLLSLVGASALLTLGACAMVPQSGAAGATQSYSVAVGVPGTPQEALQGNAQVTLDQQTSNFLMQLAQGSMQGNGNIILYWDTAAPTTPGQSAIPTSGSYTIINNNMMMWQSMVAGEHVITIQMVDANNMPLNPPVVQSYKLTVQPLAGSTMTMPAATTPAATSATTSAMSTTTSAMSTTTSATSTTTSPTPATTSATSY
jgi:hypothetical protein